MYNTSSGLGYFAAESGLGGGAWNVGAGLSAMLAMLERVCVLTMGEGTEWEVETLMPEMVRLGRGGLGIGEDMVGQSAGRYYWERELFKDADICLELQNRMVDEGCSYIGG